MTRRETLSHELDRLRRGYLRSRTLLFALFGLCALVFLFFSFAALDLTLRLPTAVCWLTWLGMLALVGGSVWLVRRTARQRVSDSAMAVLVEHVLPGAENHLINAVQIGERLPHAQRFVEQLLSEADLGLDVVRERDLYSQKPRVWALRALGGMALVLALLTLITPKGMGHVTGRFFLPMAGIEPYTRTRIQAVKPGDATVMRGENLTVAVEFAGARAEGARVVLERGKGKPEDVQLVAREPDPDQSAASTGQAMSCELKGVFYAARYRVVGGDARSRWYGVGVTNPPGLGEWRAEIIPPDYVKRDKYRLDNTSENTEVPVGSTVGLLGYATTDLSTVSVVQDEAVLATQNTAGRRKFGLKFHMGDGGPIRLRMQAESGLEATSGLPFVVLLDQTPGVVLVDTKQRILASRDARVPVAFRSEDDYGVVRVGLQRMLEEGRYEEVSTAAPESVTTVFTGRFLIDVPSFGVREGDTLRFRIWAEDNGPTPARRRGYCSVVQIAIPVPEERRKAKEEVAKQSRDSILTLIKMQRENLRSTRAVSDRVVLGKTVASGQIQELQIAQASVRDLGVGLLKDRAALGDLATVLAGLVNHEMSQVLEAFEEAHRANAKELPAKLQECVRLESEILAALTGVRDGMANEQQHQKKTDLFTALQKLVAGQRKNLKDSEAALAAQDGALTPEQLAQVEDELSSDLLTFTDQCLELIEQRVDDEFAAQIRQVYDLLEDQSIYDKMLGVAEDLDGADLARAVQAQEEILKVLLQGLNILNAWRIKNAERIVKEAAEVLKETADKLEQLEAKQAHIAEVTRDLTARGEMDDEVREKLAEMDEDQKDMAKMVEEMANDLYQFPELPVCNELNSKMREIYEDVEQALDSENAAAVEIAVQKEDGLLDAIRNTKERVEDVEMWLPDVPDNIVWNMESYDTDEFPEIPLVPLPDELEDIVGELLDQAASIEAQSQDTTGNSIIADMEMGWGIMDGPMPSFSAKGKSGNMRPNDNEMTGRSGAGREGQSNGELVENHVKGLEGRKTHARRTQDPFQQGMVTEDEDSTMDARSTGGGKLGGESESIGMFGKAPRRDLHTPEHGTAPTKLRQETEALYATARLLYLGTGSLGTVARELRGVEDAKHKMRNFGSLHRRVLRRLEDTQVELSSGVVLPMPVASVSKTGGAVTEEVDIGQISEEYRDIVSDYYRSLGSE